MGLPIEADALSLTAAGSVEPLVAAIASSRQVQTAHRAAEALLSLDRRPQRGREGARAERIMVRDPCRTLSLMWVMVT
jgi:hypothetical protein